MHFERISLAACAAAAVAIATPAAAGAASTLSYFTGMPSCTTKDAQRPSGPGPQLNTIANDSWMQARMPSQPPIYMHHEQSPNDFPGLNGLAFPPSFQQSDDDAAARIPKPVPFAPIALGKQIFFISTCSSPA